MLAPGGARSDRSRPSLGPIPALKVTAGHNCLDAIGLVSGHLTICTRLSCGARRHDSNFIFHRPILFFSFYRRPLQNEVSFQKPLTHAGPTAGCGSIHKTRPLFKPWPPWETCCHRAVQLKTYRWISKAPICPLSPAHQPAQPSVQPRNLSPFLLSGGEKGHVSQGRWFGLKWRWRGHPGDPLADV